MQKNYNTILFDLDGTLIDPKEGLLNSIKYTLDKLEIKEDNPDKIENSIGLPIRDILKKNYSLDESKLNFATEKFNEYFTIQGMFENKIYENIPELLNSLSKNSKKIIAITLKPTVHAVEILKKFKLDEYFYFISGTDLNIDNISKSRIIYKSLEEMGSEAEREIIMVGDQKNDIIGANENNIDSIGVLYGYGKKEELESENPTYLASNIDNLKTILI